MALLTSIMGHVVPKELIGKNIEYLFAFIFSLYHEVYG